VLNSEIQWYFCQEFDIPLEAKSAPCDIETVCRFLLDHGASAKILNSLFEVERI
jgi:hypothetical protein